MTVLEEYLNNGFIDETTQPVEKFIRAVLENNLSESFGLAPRAYQHELRNIIGYVRQHVPSNAWGSTAIVEAYSKKIRKST
jgi:hypothetical protein